MRTLHHAVPSVPLQRGPHATHVPRWGRVDAFHGDGWGWTRHELALRPPDLTRREGAALALHEWSYAIGCAAGLLVALALGGWGPDWFVPLALAAGLFGGGLAIRRATSAAAARVRRVSATTAYFDGAPHRIESEWVRYERATGRMRELEAKLRRGEIGRPEFVAGWRAVYDALPEGPAHR